MIEALHPRVRCSNRTRYLVRLPDTFKLRKVSHHPTIRTRNLHRTQNDPPVHTIDRSTLLPPQAIQLNLIWIFFVLPLM